MRPTLQRLLLRKLSFQNGFQVPLIFRARLQVHPSSAKLAHLDNRLHMKLLIAAAPLLQREFLRRQILRQHQRATFQLQLQMSALPWFLSLPRTCFPGPANPRLPCERCLPEPPLPISQISERFSQLF